MNEISDEIGIFFTRNHLGHIGYWPFEAGNRLLLNNQIDVKIFTGDIYQRTRVRCFRQQSLSKRKRKYGPSVTIL